MIETKGRYNVEMSESEDVFGKERLVVRGPILIQAGGVTLIVAVREKIRTDELRQASCLTIPGGSGRFCSHLAPSTAKDVGEDGEELNVRRIVGHTKEW